jgi:sugar-specific transcriptional regulator TrmB
MEKELISLGMSKKEAKVYLICLKTGSTTANRISSLSGIARSTIYDILEKLKQSGYINTFIKDKKTYFSPTDPKTIPKTIEEEKRHAIKSLDKKKESFNKLLPKIKEIQNKIKEKPRVEVYEGIRSISKLLDNMIESAKLIKIIGNQEQAIERLGYRTDRFRTIRKKRRQINRNKIHQISRKFQGGNIYLQKHYIALDSVSRTNSNKNRILRLYKIKRNNLQRALEKRKIKN